MGFKFSHVFYVLSPTVVVSFLGWFVSFDSISLQWFFWGFHMSRFVEASQQSQTMMLLPNITDITGRGQVLLFLFVLFACFCLFVVLVFGLKNTWNTRLVWIQILVSRLVWARGVVLWHTEFWVGGNLPCCFPELIGAVFSLTFFQVAAFVTLDTCFWTDFHVHLNHKTIFFC